jgi:hypothetical protein
MEAAASAGGPQVTSRREELLRRRWLDVLRTELVRREEGEDGAARREGLIAELQDRLDLIAERIRAAPDYVEPSDAQKAQWGRELDIWFRQNYGGRRGPR